MTAGILAGVLWGMDTVILGIALASSGFVSTEKAVMLAPFVSTFLHDAASSAWMLLYTGIRKQFPQVMKALKSRSGKFIILGALLGGPVGMSGYVAAIHYIGPAYTAIISSLFPALGAMLSYIFLKEKMSVLQLGGLAASIAGVIALGYAPGGEIRNMGIGFACALLCCAGWAAEAVICAYGMKDPAVTDEQALQIRQLTSALFYGIVILNVLRGWNFTMGILPTGTMGIIVCSAFFGTASYLCYYRAIATIGASRSMALNITYAAWSVVFAVFLLHQLPDAKSILCGIVIVLGSLTAANGNCFSGQK